MWVLLSPDNNTHLSLINHHFGQFMCKGNEIIRNNENKSKFCTNLCERSSIIVCARVGIFLFMPSPFLLYANFGKVEAIIVYL